MAVADGVGGWADSGVDPSIFSQALMYFGWAAASATKEKKFLTPLEIMQSAYKNLMMAPEVTAG